MRLPAILLPVAILMAATAAAAATAVSHQGGAILHSSLDGKSVLPTRIHWTARPSVPTAQVKAVQFFIDGRLSWVEHNAPYVYGDDGNWLVTTFLTPGRHVFRATLIPTSGPHTSDTVTARVLPAPPPPPALAGTWSRTATKQDLQKCMTATQGGCPPTGNWKITISPSGWSPTDPQGNRGLFDVQYLGGDRVQLRPTIEYPPYPNSNNGGWCSDTDPLANWTATTDPAAQTLTLHPQGTDKCGDRAAILEGIWTRIAQ